MRSYLLLFCLLFAVSSMLGQSHQAFGHKGYTNASKTGNSSSYKELYNAYYDSSVAPADTSNKTTYQYYTNALTATRYEQHSTFNILVLSKKDSFILDNSGRVIYQYIYNWNAGWDKIDPEYEYTYTATGKPDSIKTFIPNGLPSMYLDRVHKFTYSAADKLTAEYWIKNNSGSWDTTEFFLYNHNSSDQLISAYAYSYSSGPLEGWSKDSLIYDTNGQLSLQYAYDWNSSTSDFNTAPDRRYTFQYDGNGNMLSAAREGKVNNQWVYQYRDDYYYDLCVASSDVSSIFFVVGGDAIGLNTEPFMNANKMDSAVYLNYNAGLWEYNGTVYTYYDGPTSNCVGIDELVNENWSIYPNPASDVVTISCPVATAPVNFKLVNLEGKVVMDRMINSVEETISVADLRPGIYFSIISTDGIQQAPKKLIVY